MYGTRWVPPPTYHEQTRVGDLIVSTVNTGLFGTLGYETSVFDHERTELASTRSHTEKQARETHTAWVSGVTNGTLTLRNPEE